MTREPRAHGGRAGHPGDGPPAGREDLVLALLRLSRDPVLRPRLAAALAALDDGRRPWADPDEEAGCCAGHAGGWPRPSSPERRRRGKRSGGRASTPGSPRWTPRATARRQGPWARSAPSDGCRRGPRRGRLSGPVRSRRRAGPPPPDSRSTPSRRGTRPRSGRSCPRAAAPWRSSPRAARRPPGGPGMRCGASWGAGAGSSPTPRPSSAPPRPWTRRGGRGRGTCPPPGWRRRMAHPSVAEEEFYARLGAEPGTVGNADGVLCRRREDGGLEPLDGQGG